MPVVHFLFCWLFFEKLLYFHKCCWHLVSPSVRWLFYLISFQTVGRHVDLDPMKSQVAYHVQDSPLEMFFKQICMIPYHTFWCHIIHMFIDLLKPLPAVNMWWQSGTLYEWPLGLNHTPYDAVRYHGLRWHDNSIWCHMLLPYGILRQRKMLFDNKRCDIVWYNMLPYNALRRHRDLFDSSVQPKQVNKPGGCIVLPFH